MNPGPGNRWWTSGGLLVASSGGVITLPPRVGLGHVVLDLPGLLLIEGLGRGTIRNRRGIKLLVEQHAGNADALEQLFDDLKNRGDIVRGKRPSGDRDRALASQDGVPQTASARTKPPDTLVMVSPLMFRASQRGFEWARHDGQLLHLSAIELYATRGFKTSSETERAFVEQREQLGSDALGREDFDALVMRLFSARVLIVPDATDRDWVKTTSGVPMPRFRHDHKDRILEEYRRMRTETSAHQDAHERLPVVPVNATWTVAPAALGLLISHARAFQQGVLARTFDFKTQMLTDRHDLAEIAAERGIYLFSNYTWNHGLNRTLSALVKRANPASITIHGGPDTPAYPADNERYFLANPHVDITVRGEGEATFVEILSALAPQASQPAFDLRCLTDVAGLSYRDGQSVRRTADRARIEDLDTIPSPVLSGLLAPFAQIGSGTTFVLESNRGCPYGCTFCDWGSATLSRIRKFDLQRVFDELEWCARNEVWSVVLADANFGVFERDTQIAERVAELKRQFGFPGFFGTNYAKNGVKHLSRIIDVLAGAGILAEAKVSLQTHDSPTLVAVRRKNIKTSSYDELATELQRQGLPLSVELMMGLPGSTTESFLADLQHCIDRDVRSMVYTTVLLPNSPMNDPAYRTEHGIVALAGQELRQTSSYTREEWAHMQRLASVYLLCDSFGVLRQVATYVRSETGMREIDVYERMLVATQQRRYDWPMMASTFEVIPTYMVPPAGWRLFLDEVRRFLTTELAVLDDSALDTVMTVQLALLPAPERTFPERHELAHDYEKWHARVRLQQQMARGAAWNEIVPPLRSFPSATFVVTDPNGVCADPTSGTILSRSLQAGSWELGSNVARGFARMTRLDADRPKAAPDRPESRQGPL